MKKEQKQKSDEEFARLSFMTRAYAGRPERKKVENKEVKDETNKMVTKKRN